jgi:hypothetical protein
MLWGEFGSEETSVVVKVLSPSVPDLDRTLPINNFAFSLFRFERRKRDSSTSEMASAIFIGIDLPGMLFDEEASDTPEASLGLTVCGEGKGEESLVRSERGERLD